jgi:2,3-bisphosphoglycerate-dependent phosphoglycerate mutase
MAKLFIALFPIVLFLSIAAYGQNKMIILVRHAEKVDSESSDPELSEAGRTRAARLAKIIRKYRPGAVYSTDYKRTRDTAAPIAARRRLRVETYDARKPDELVQSIMKSRIKRNVVVGHSNTVPGLANLLGGKELFKNLADSEYGVIWIVRIKDGRVRRTEVIPF